jgi:hypothetical protein
MQITTAETTETKSYSKQAHSFIEDGQTINAIVYGGLDHPNDINGNIHIVDLGEGHEGGRYMLTLENDGLLSDDLKDLEPRLFEWMRTEGYEEDSK